MDDRRPSVPVDLGVATVFIDFDGTITTTDTGAHLLKRAADPAWRDVERRYKSGEIGSRECLQRQWELIALRDEGALRAIVDEVALDPVFEPLIQLLRSRGAEVVVLSDGYGIRADSLCRDLGLSLISNRIDWASWSVIHEFPRGPCGCPGCGTCKPMAIREAAARGRTTILVDDGMSDRRGALVADHVFAKGELARCCLQDGLPFVNFGGLADVLSVLWGSTAVTELRVADAP